MAIVHAAVANTFAYGMRLNILISPDSLDVDGDTERQKRPAMVPHYRIDSHCRLGTLLTSLLQLANVRLRQNCRQCSAGNKFVQQPHRFSAVPCALDVVPVAFPSGRLKLVTRPSATGVTAAALSTLRRGLLRPRFVDVRTRSRMSYHRTHIPAGCPADSSTAGRRRQP